MTTIIPTKLRAATRQARSARRNSAPTSRQEQRLDARNEIDVALATTRCHFRS